MTIREKKKEPVQSLIEVDVEVGVGIKVQWGSGLCLGGAEEGVMVEPTGIGLIEELEQTIWRNNSTASISIYLQSCGIKDLNGMEWILMLDQSWWVGMGVGSLVLGNIGVRTSEDLEWTIWFKNLSASISICLRSWGLRSSRTE